MKEFKNVRINYECDTLIRVENKNYQIHHCLDREDILVDMDGKYPTLFRVIKANPSRSEDGCVYQNTCGGCQFMHMTYDYEILHKQKYLKQLLSGFSENVSFVPSEHPLHYRNKCQMTYQYSKSKKVVCGFYEEGSHRLVTVENCLLQSTEANELILKINRILSQYKIEPYDEQKKVGVLKHIFVRVGFQTKEIMVVLVTNGEIFPGRSQVVKELLKIKGITTIVQNFNARNTSIVLGERQKILSGSGFIREKVGDYLFKISPQSFFQINSFGIKKLYDIALSKAFIKPTDIVLDAYCGVGTISIFAAAYAKKVIGVEVNRHAIADARINARWNHISNVEFSVNDATRFLTEQAKNRSKIDIVILDPPREGSTSAFIHAVGFLKPRQVIYISCNPITLKRDLILFSQEHYKVQSITGVDMFPKTKHIECVAQLTYTEKSENKKKSV